MAFLFETQRLQLRWMNVADEDFILRLVNEPGWLEHIGDRGIRTLNDARAYIVSGPMELYREHGFGLYAVILKATGQPIGICGLVKRAQFEEADLGFAFLECQQGRGYALEACEAVLAYAVRSLGKRRLLAITSPTNHASSRLLAKLGFRAEGSAQLAKDGKKVSVYGWTAPPFAQSS